MLSVWWNWIDDIGGGRNGHESGIGRRRGGGNKDFPCGWGKGRLIYRGHRAEDSARTRSPEEVAFLLWNGTLPDPDEREAVRRQWAGARVLPGYLKGLIAAIPREVQMTDVLRTAVSAMGDASFEGPPTPEQAIRIAALLPSIIAFRRHHLAGTEPPAPRPDLSHVAHYLYLLRGEVPSPAHVRALEAYFVLTAEHGMNASTFAARVSPPPVPISFPPSWRRSGR